MSLLFTKTSKNVFPSKYKCPVHTIAPNQITKVNQSHRDTDDSQVFMGSSGLQGYGGLISK